jgi:molybdate transport system substrate-binding protein
VIVGLFLFGCSSPATTPDAKEPNKETAPVEKKEIIVSAAASLKNAMTEIEKVYEGKNTGIDLTFNFGSSGSLQQQIEQGAPADIFLSAEVANDALETKIS